jgi:hypothetical protein
MKDYSGYFYSFSVAEALELISEDLLNEGLTPVKVLIGYQSYRALCNCFGKRIDAEILEEISFRIFGENKTTVIKISPADDFYLTYNFFNADGDLIKSIKTKE